MTSDRVSRTHLLGIISGLLRAADLLAVLAGAVLAKHLLELPLNFAGPEILVTVTLVLAAALGFDRSEGYAGENIGKLTLRFNRILLFWAILIIAMMGLSNADAKIAYVNTTWLLVTGGVTAAMLLINRLFLMALISRWRSDQRLAKLIAIAGSGELAVRLVKQIQRQGQADHLIVGVFGDQCAELDAMRGKVPLGNLDQLGKLLQTGELDDVLLAYPSSQAAAFQTALSKVREAPINIRLVPENLISDLHINGFSKLAGMPLLHLFEKPLSGWATVVKALEDRILGVMILALFAPIMLLAAIAIKVDSKGPVLFRQVRYGFNNNKFVVYKFRTMRTDWDPQSAPLHAQKKDPRITRVGAFLRKTSLDELPQIFNVMIGNMSLVGPRPHAVAHTAAYAEQVDGYFARHRVKPGITGWAQVNGFRGDADAPEMIRARVQHDLEYIENWSLVFDLKIILMTPMVGFIHKNAY